MGLWSWLTGADDPRDTAISELTAKVETLQESLLDGYGGSDPDADLPLTGGASRAFRPLSKGRRDMSPLRQEKALELSHYLYDSNGIAKRALELMRDFVVGEGISVQSDVSMAELPDDAPPAQKDAVREQAETAQKAQQQVLDRFWNDSQNKMDLKLYDRVLELGIAGELLITAAVNPKDGFVKLGSYDPADISAVVCDQANMEQPIEIVLKSASGGANERLRVVREDSDPRSKSFGRLVGVETDAAGKVVTTYHDQPGSPERPYLGSCFFFAVNKVSHAKRGRPDLLAAVDWIDGYDQFMASELDRHILMKSFIYDVTVQGDPTAVQARATQLGKAAPRPGSLNVHSTAETWAALTPDLKSSDSAEYANLLLSYVSTALGLPRTWLNGTMDVNKSVASEFAEPAYKRLMARQRYVLYMIEQIARFVLDQAELRGRLPKRANAPGDVRPEPWAIKVQAPEIRSKELASLADTFTKISDSLPKLVEASVVDVHASQELAVLLFGLLGVEVNLEDLRARLDQAADEGLEDELEQARVNELVPMELSGNGHEPIEVVSQ